MTIAMRMTGRGDQELSRVDCPGIVSSPKNSQRGWKNTRNLIVWEAGPRISLFEREEHHELTSLSDIGISGL